MRGFVVALVAVSMLFVLTGCGGGGGEETVTETPPPAEAAPPPPAEGSPITDRSKPESATVFEEFPKGSQLPTAVAENLEVGQPMLILFVDGSQKVTNEVRSAVDAAVKKYTGVVDLIVYDLSKYASTDASGQVNVDGTGLTEDPKNALATSLARELKVSGRPYIVMTDDQSFVVFRHRGLVDTDFLLMHMGRLTD